MLIALGSIGRLDLLTSLADDVVVPEIVAEEILRVADQAALAFSRATLRRENVTADGSVNRWRLEPGETAVLSFAKRNAGFVAVLDDLAARRCAKAHGIHTHGAFHDTRLTAQNKTAGITSGSRMEAGGIEPGSLGIREARE